MIEKVSLDANDRFRKTGHTSKGDQLKWKIGNIWYKADYMGYEGLAEVLVSNLLAQSNLRYPVVSYEPVRIEYQGNILRGCKSDDFLMEGQSLIPVEKLYRRYTGQSLAVKLSEFSETEDRIQYLVDIMTEITGIPDFGPYLTEMLEIDAFFLNEDRHTNNIAVIYDEKTTRYSLSPIFDHGLCLFADMYQDYPITDSIESCIKKITAKPFDRDFDAQLEAAESLYGKQVAFTFRISDILQEVSQLAEWYPAEINQRVEDILRMQIRKYAYLIKK